jgi:hypothetical protein
MTSEKQPNTPQPQVIRSVSVKGYGRTRLTLQSVCGVNGERFLRAVWQYQGDDGQWYTKKTPPEFSPKVWTDALATAATSGMLSSGDYKELLVRLTRGLDGSKSPTPKAYVRFTGKLQVSFSPKVLSTCKVDEVLVYESLTASAREVTVTQSHQKKTDTTFLVYEVIEDIHYTDALSRLPKELRDAAGRQSLEEAVAQDPRGAFLGIFGDPRLASAGFDEDKFALDFALTVL